MTRPPRIGFVFAALLGSALVGCGGSGSSGGNSGGGSSAPPPTGFAITTTTLPQGIDGVAYAAQLTAANGTGKLTWTMSMGPTGLSLSPDGMLTGTPAARSCNAALSVSVSDSASPAHTATQLYTFLSEGLESGARDAQVGVYYGQGFNVLCPIEPISWSVSAGTLPPGLTPRPFPGADSQLDLIGAPTQPGNFAFTVQAKDGAGHSLPLPASVHVLPLRLAVADNLMQLGVVNQPFHHTLNFTGGTPPYSFVIGSGMLPAGLQLNVSTGEIAGTPTAAGFSQFTIHIVDSTSPDAFTANKPDSILVTPAALPARNDGLSTATPIGPGTYDASLSPYVNASGGAAPDQDYFVLNGAAGDTFTIGVGANVPTWHSSVNFASYDYTSTDPALEILDGAGHRLATCNDAVLDAPPTNAPFLRGNGDLTDPCVSHSGDTSFGSGLTLRLATAQPFYIHVFDFQGRARPDLLYELHVAKQ